MLPCEVTCYPPPSPFDRTTPRVRFLQELRDSRQARAVAHTPLREMCALRDALLTSDADFCKHVARVPQAKYRAFLKRRRAERPKRSQRSRAGKGSEGVEALVQGDEAGRRT